MRLLHPRLRTIGLLVILAAGFLVYSRTFGVPFQFDDLPAIKNNPAVQNLADIRGIWRFWPTRFLTYLSFALNYRWHMFRLPGYHLVNLLIHLGNAVLVWRLFLQTFSTPALTGRNITGQAEAIAFFGGLLFAVHPVQTQAVTYIYQRATGLATLFYLGSFNLYVSARLARTSGKKTVCCYTAACLLALAGMFTKEIVFTLPLMLVLYEIFFLAGNQTRNLKYVLPLMSLLLVIPVLAAGTHLLRLADFRSVKAVQGTGFITQKEYLLTQAHGLLIYLKLLAVPLNQNLDYDFPVSRGFLETGTWCGFLTLALLILLAVSTYRHHRLVAWAVAWFILAILPQSSLIPKPDLLVEHRLYLPLVGYALFLPAGLYHIFGNHRRAAVSLLLMAVCFYAVLAYRRNEVWRSTLGLWNDTVQKSPAKARPYLNRGLAYAEKGLLEAALRDYTTALVIYPGYVEGYNNRGIVLASQGQYSRALADFNQAISLNPGYPISYHNRGITWATLGESQKALADFDTALKLNPRYAEAYKSRGILYLNQKAYDQAVAEFTKALQIRPGYPEFYYCRAVAYLLAGQAEKARWDAGQAEKSGYRLDPAFLRQLQQKASR